jgi:hypothetical protein
MIMIEVEDPTGAEARFCLDAYVRELDARFENGFDPTFSTVVGS